MSTQCDYLQGKTPQTKLLRNSQERGIVTQGVGMDGTVEARALHGSLASVVERVCAGRLIRSMPTVAGKEPAAGFSWQPTPVLAQFFEQSGAEHDVAVLAALSSADMNHHALAVDVADLQVC